MTGTVKFFNGSKGFGFITNDETGEDIFVHVTSLDGINLNEGDKVCLLYTSPSPRDYAASRMPSSA